MTDPFRWQYLVIFLHYLGDFALIPPQLRRRKQTDASSLAGCCLIHALTMFAGLLPVVGLPKAVVYTVFLELGHLCTALGDIVITGGDANEPRKEYEYDLHVLNELIFVTFAIWLVEQILV